MGRNFGGQLVLDPDLKDNDPEAQDNWFAQGFLANLTKYWKKRSFT